jgi:hypothetical protein
MRAFRYLVVVRGHWGKFFSEYFGFPLSVLHAHLDLPLT